MMGPLLRGLFIQATGGPVLVRSSAASPTLYLSASGETDQEIAESLAGQATGISLPQIVSVNDETFEVTSLDPDNSHAVSGRVAVVTGGAQGFGAEIVRGLVSQGCFCFIADLNLAGAKKLATELGAKTIAIQVDVADENSVINLFKTIEDLVGGVDLVVSNAGVLKAGSVLSQPSKDFAFTTQVNYLSFFLMCKYAGQLLARQHLTASNWWTDIVQINSKSGLVGSNKNGAYAGSKFGGIGLVQSFALELVHYGIKVNAICPGNYYDGPLWSDPEHGLFVQYLHSGKVPGASTVADVREFYEAKTPIRRGVTGTDVLKALYYVVEQQYETGQALPVTGGQVMLS